MPRARDPNRDKAFEIWKEKKGEITNREIATHLDIDEKKVAVWKQRDKWNVVQQTKINVVQQKKKRPKKARSPNVKTKEEPILESEELTDKQWLFCMYYVKYFSAIKAYQKAFECDYKTAHSNSYRMMANEGIRKQISQYKKDIANGILIDAHSVLQKYIDIAFADITDFVEFGQEKRPELDHNLEPIIDENGDEVTYAFSYVNLKDYDEVDGTVITEVKKGKDGVSVKLADKMKALEFLSKYTDLLNENDRKKLQEERLKTEIAKTKAEIEKIEGDKGASEDWVAALKEVAEKRKQVKANE